MRRATVIINIVGLVACGMVLMQGVQEESWFKLAIGTLCLLANVVSLNKYMGK